MLKSAVTGGKATRKAIKGHPGVYTFVNVKRNPEREHRVVESIMTRADRPQERVLRS